MGLEFAFHTSLFFIDWIAALILMLAKEFKVLKNKESSGTVSNILTSFSTNIILIFLAIFFFEIAISRIYAQIDFWQSIQEFLWIKEFGIPQIFLLVPLLFIMNLQQYNLLFIKTEHFKILPLAYLKSEHFFTNLLLVFQGVIFLSFTYIIKADNVLLILLILIKLIVDLIILPKIRKRSIEKLLNSQYGKSRYN